MESSPASSLIQQDIKLVHLETGRLTLLITCFATSKKTSIVSCLVIRLSHQKLLPLTLSLARDCFHFELFKYVHLDAVDVLEALLIFLNNNLFLYWILVEHENEG